MDELAQKYGNGTHPSDDAAVVSAARRPQMEHEEDDPEVNEALLTRWPHAAT